MTDVKRQSFRQEQNIGKKLQNSVCPSLHDCYEKRNRMCQHRKLPTIMSACILFFVNVGIVTSRSISSVPPYTMPPESKVSNDFTNTTFGKLSSSKECTLTSHYPVRDTMEGFLLEGAKLIELDLVLENYPPDFLYNRFKHIFLPHHWVRTTGREGRKLLTLEDNYDFMSVATLSMNVKKIKVNLTDTPRSCLKTLDEKQTLMTFRTLLLNDFKSQGQEDGSLSEDEHICHMKIIEEAGFASFIYSCCHKSPDGDIVCVDIDKDVWTRLLLVFVIFTKIMTVLFSPFFIPKRLYRDDLGLVEYVYQPNTPTRNKASTGEERDKKQPNSITGETDINCQSQAEDLDHSQTAENTFREFTLKVVEEKPGEDEAKKVVAMRKLKEMHNFWKLVVRECTSVKLLKVTYKAVRLSVKSRHLLDKNTVPAGVFTVLYNNLVRCRLRRFNVMEDCCNESTGICGLTWYKCGRVLSKLVLLCLCLLPWALRLWVYFTYEEDVVSQKKRMAARYGLKYWSGSLTLILTPLHVVFILTYVVLVADFLMYETINRAWKKMSRFVLAKSLNDMSELKMSRLCKGFMPWLIWPCDKMGAFGIVLYPFYAVFLLIAGLPVVAFYLCPALQLTARFVKHSIRFRVQWFGRHGTEEKEVEDEVNHWIKLVIIFMCFVFFWSLTFLFMETLTFFAEVAVYTLTGIIVNAQHTLDYITVAVFVVVYARTTFNGVHKKYLKYHRQIQEELLKMRREEINEVANQNEKDQLNMAFHVPGYPDLDKGSSEHDIIELIVYKGRPRFITRGILLFLDNKNTVYTPEWFFYEAITLKHPEAPGSLYLSYSEAFRNFGFILLFLVFVFIVVMAFGDTYQISPTNKLLATAAGSFIPFLFRNVFSSGKGESNIDTESIQFRELLQKQINNYEQKWIVFDFGTPVTPAPTVDRSKSLWFLPSCLQIKKKPSRDSSKENQPCIETPETQNLRKDSVVTQEITEQLDGKTMQVDMILVMGVKDSESTHRASDDT